MQTHPYKALELIRQPRFVQRFVLYTFVILAIFIGLLFLPWRQNVQGIGSLIALDPTQRDYTVKATVDGFLETIYVKENDFVRKGDALFSMRDLDQSYHKRLEQIKSSAQEAYRNQQTKIAALRNNLTAIQRYRSHTLEVFRSRRSQLRKELELLQTKQKAFQNTVEMERINLQRATRLRKKGLESQRDFELKKNRYLLAKADLADVTTRLQNKKRALEILHQEQKVFENETELKYNDATAALLEAQNTANKIQQRLATLTSDIKRYATRTIKAKNDGYVVRIFQNDANKLIKKGEDILYFSPIVTTRAIRLKVADFHMPLMRPGLKTRIIFYGWPAMQISGWPKISHGTYGGIVHAIERSRYEENTYYIIVVEDPKDDPWPDTEALKIGTQASVWINLNVVPIWYEIWRLMIAQPPQMVNAPIEEHLRW